MDDWFVGKRITLVGIGQLVYVCIHMYCTVCVCVCRC